MAQLASPGLADLEKELVCSICTELLYQPLTLLDCLHTFCGSCVKEWFTAQGSRRRPSTSSSARFTCPSCRADVRGTRPNATVTTLVDMVLAAHPDRVKSAAEKDEIAKRYKPSDSVFPPDPPHDESAEEDNYDDDRLLEEVRELSLRESRAQARRENRRADPSRNHEPRNDSGRHAAEGRTRRRQDETSAEQRTQRLGSRPGRDGDRTRRIEHQSSLRSLLSLSSEAETMEEEILRQIIEEGLLDDIDLDNLGPAQEEELSERIADAYRRRHMQRSNSRQSNPRRHSPDVTSRTQTRSQSAQRSSEPAPTSREQDERRPPVSRPHLLDQSRPSNTHQRRNSDQTSERQHTSPLTLSQASASDDMLRPAARSSSDMTSERSRASQAGRPRLHASSTRLRRATEPDQNISDVWMGGGRERSSSRQVSSQTMTNSPSSVSSPRLEASHGSTPTDQATHPLSSPLVPTRGDLSLRSGRSRPSSSRSNVPPSPGAHFIEPSISCECCGKQNIQYNLHKRCPQCKDGNYHICLRCYRAGRGCLRWNGFGASAQETFEQILASSNRQPAQTKETGHILVSVKYTRPAESAYRTIIDNRRVTNDNPANRRITGLFCDICQSVANDCFWKCSQCNQGDWGFCNRCVNQGRCCTHALLPIRRITASTSSSAPSTPADAMTAGPTCQPEPESYKILSFSTNCDICTYPIPASVTRFHCLECNGGDYDVCTNCYLKLVATSKITKENGHNGWRRCLAGHRMIIVGFEDHQSGQRRVVVHDLVGGRALKDEHVASSTSSPAPTSPELGKGDWSWKDGSDRRKKASRLRGALASNNNTATSDPSSTGSPVPQQAPSFRRFPPDGGVGLVVHALWSWYPEDEVEDELTFPRGAEITEAENINDDWFWGCYAGRTGLFPGAHVTVVSEVV
ncbi:Zinc finger RING-type [Penicillium lagena]|uniref:Zinc finger RING-type n=1 Tax=Penicillium lagena TaxID=94218 RepID=UPI00254243A9|nr:Zinc finger RING-type [Penicillium lagena]KAJ5613277.1 Zinc finger RING-type [Penicillium lagena]